MRLYSKLLAIITIIWLVVILFVITTDSLNPDEATHSLIGKFIKDMILDWLKNPTLSYKKLYDYAISYLVYYPKLSLHYPPLLHIFFAFSYMIFGTSVLVGRLVVVAFSVAFIYLVKECTYKISKNKEAALLAPLIFMSSPVFIYNAIAAAQEIIFLFFFTLTVFLYWRLLDKDNEKNRLLVIVSTVLCVLSKWQAVLIVPVVLAFTYFENRGKIKKVLIPIIISLLILTPYYLLLYKTGLLFIPFSYTINADVQDPTWKEPAGWLYYLKSFVLEQFPFIGIILLVATIYYLKEKQYGWKLFLVWIIIVYLAMTFIHNKDTRYDINMMPAFVIPSSIVIANFCKKQYKKLLPIFFILLIAQFAYTVQNNVIYLQNAESISKYVVSNAKGNILTDFIQFTFEIAKIDGFKHQIIRDCAIKDSNDTYEKTLNRYGVEYIILKKDNGDAFYKYVSTSGKFTKEMESGDVVVFRNKNFMSTQQKELCNYICSTKAVVCTSYSNPKDALV